MARIVTVSFVLLVLFSFSIAEENSYRNITYPHQLSAKRILPNEPDMVLQKGVANPNNLPNILRVSENATHILVDSMRNGYAWLNSAQRSVDRYSDGDVDFVLMAYRHYNLSDPNSGIIGAAEVDVSNGLEAVTESEIFDYTQLNQPIASGTIGGRYPSAVALDYPFITFNQYISGDANTQPAVSSPYLITDWDGAYGDDGGDWTEPRKMDEGYTHHDSPGGNRLWNGPTAIVYGEDNAYHYLGCYSNWFIESEGQDNDNAILNASATEPTDDWNIDSDPELIDPNEWTIVSPAVAMNSSGFGVIAGTGHEGYHEGDSYLFAELRIVMMTTDDYGATWSEPREVDWDEMGIQTYITLEDSFEYFIDDTTTALYEGDAFVGTNFDCDVLVTEDNDIHLGWNLLWGRPGDEGWYPSWWWSGFYVSSSFDEGASFEANLIATNNGFFVGDSIIPGMSGILFDSEIDLATDEDGNLYAAWLDRPSNPVELAEKPNYGTGDPSYKLDIYAAQSTDQGQTWSERINVTNTVSEDEYELNLAKSASVKNGGTIYLGYCLVDVNSEPFEGGDDNYTDRVNHIWLAEAGSFPTGLDDGAVAEVPSEFSLNQNYPNPFNPSTRIEFTAAENGVADLTVFNIRGEKVGTIFHGAVKRGQAYALDFDGSNLAAGVYFYRLTIGAQQEVRKMVMVK